MRRLLAILFVPLMSILVSPLDAEETSVEGPSATESLPQPLADVVAAMDRDADPCTDFYRYACGGWIDANELPPDQSRWIRSFSLVGENNRKVIRDILEQAAEAPGDAADRRKIGEFYASCMAEPAIAKAGVAPLAPYLEAIAGIDSVATMMKVAGKIHRFAAGSLFDAGVIPDFKNPEKNLLSLSQGGLGMPDRDYYTSDDEKKRQLLADYEDHVQRMLELLGESDEQAARHAAQVVAFETELAEPSRPRQEMRIPEKLYHKLDLAGLDKLTPELPWKLYLQATGHPDIVDINVETPEFFTALEKLLTTSSPEVLQAYLRWHLLRDVAGLLPEAFVTASFDFYGAKLAGQKEIRPRWKRCVDATERSLGEVVGKIYVERQFAGASKDIAVEMIHDIETAFAANLAALTWMDDATRKRALEKVHAVANKVGYPDSWRDYSAMKIDRRGYFDNALAARQFEFDRLSRKIGQPVDRSEWRMTPQTVNAYYNPLLNEMAFPAGIMQPPIFHREFPAAMNYGSVGAAMGHELTHGFDDSGRKFDPSGRLSEWWEPEVIERFETRAECVSNLYSDFEIEPGVAVNGQLTLGENVADIGGVKHAFAAYKSWEARNAPVAETIPGLTNDQLFFVAYGQIWCARTTAESARMRVTVDPHSPPRFRTNGTLSNVHAFTDTFGCSDGDKMFRKDVCEVW